jgi:hypothetical protein
VQAVPIPATEAQQRSGSLNFYPPQNLREGGLPVEHLRRARKRFTDDFRFHHSSFTSAGWALQWAWHGKLAELLTALQMATVRLGEAPEDAAANDPQVWSRVAADKVLVRDKDFRGFEVQQRGDGGGPRRESGSRGMKTCERTGAEERSG